MHIPATYIAQETLKQHGSNQGKNSVASNYTYHVLLLGASRIGIGARRFSADVVLAHSTENIL